MIIVSLNYLFILFFIFYFFLFKIKLKLFKFVFKDIRRLYNEEEMEGEFIIAREDFNGRNRNFGSEDIDYLDIAEGNILRVTENLNNGWVLGFKNNIPRLNGIFPLSMLVNIIS